MVLKKIEIIGTSPEAFYKAVENAVKEAAKTVRGMKWAEVTKLRKDRGNADQEVQSHRENSL